MSEIWLTDSELTRAAEADFAERKRQYDEEMAKVRALKKRKKPGREGVWSDHRGTKPLSDVAQKILAAMRVDRNRIWTTVDLSLATEIARGVVGDTLRTLCNRNYCMRMGAAKNAYQGGAGYSYKLLKVEVHDE